MRTASFTIEATRGGGIESAHRIHAIVADRHGRLDTWGDRERPTIPRSAIKTIQAIPILTSGAGDACGVSEEELALACASHSGETEHVEAVMSWLDRIGLAEADLECGPDLPLGKAARRAAFTHGTEASPIFNCCSGKHAGFLAVARYLGHPTAGYIDRESPTQHLVTEALATFTDLDLDSMVSGIDGCGIPVFALPLERLAFAMARLVDPVDLPEPEATATVPVVSAAQRAFWVSGTGRTETKLAARATEPVVAKAGAEGVFMAALPDRGLGMVVKAEDGTARASHLAITGLLSRLGAIAIDGEMAAQVLTNKAGTEIGEMRAVIDSPERAQI
ncbi:MAG: asparaginase [Actinomycetota bacterium]